MTTTQALKWHPDKNSETEEQREKADKMFKLVGEANSVSHVSA